VEIKVMVGIAFQKHLGVVSAHFNAEPLVGRHVVPIGIGLLFEIDFNRRN
jgi:hypothetical protein